MKAQISKSSITKTIRIFEEGPYSTFTRFLSGLQSLLLECLRSKLQKLRIFKTRFSLILFIKLAFIV